MIHLVVEAGGLARGDWLAILGVAVSVLGFGGTIWQLVRTARASEATKAAIERTETRMAMNHLLVLLPQVRMIEVDLDTAVDAGDRRLTIRSLVMLSHVAGEVAGVLKQHAIGDAPLIAKLESAAKKASTAKVDLIGNNNKLPKSVTRDVRAEVAELTSHLSGVTTRITMEAGRPS